MKIVNVMPDYRATNECKLHILRKLVESGQIDKSIDVAFTISDPQVKIKVIKIIKNT